MDEPMLSRLQHLMQLREEVEQLSEQWSPPADWYDHDTHLELVLDVPDVPQSSLHLSYDDHAVQISGQRTHSARILYQERPMGTFERTIRFPQEVLTQTAVAKLSAGVLRIHFEKKWPTIDAAEGVK